MGYGWAEEAADEPAHEHGNDSLFYTAVEKDSLIAVLWHFWSYLSFGCLQRSNDLNRSRLK